MICSVDPGLVDARLRAAGLGAVVHLVGAGGCGMSGLGHWLLDLGYAVTGSDLVHNEAVRQLRARGARIRLGHDGDWVRALHPVLVAHSAAVRPDNPELEAARQQGMLVAPRGVLLAALTHRQRGVCVAGMHGKTTTTSLLVYALENLGAHPSYAIGALQPQLPRHARFTEGPAGGQPWMVIEADESNGTLCCLRPEHAILLNVDAEHLDYFRNLEAVCREFHEFAAGVRGWRVYCKDDPELDRMFDGQARALSFGFHPQADYRVVPMAGSAAHPRSGEPWLGEAQLFRICLEGAQLGEFTTLLPGEKNLSNAAAVIALLHRLGFPPARIAPALAGFRGAARRQQLLWGDERNRIYDDYGHHPTEVRATLRALRQLGPGRLLVAFQPHRYTRTQHLLQDFATCFAGADALWITEIYPASEPPIPGVTGAALAQAVRAAGQPVQYVPDLRSLGAAVRQAVRPGDWILFLGAGDITQAAHEMARLFSQSRQADSLSSGAEPVAGASGTGTAGDCAGPECWSGLECRAAILSQ